MELRVAVGVIGAVDVLTGRLDDDAALGVDARARAVADDLVVSGEAQNRSVGIDVAVLVDAQDVRRDTAEPSRGAGDDGGFHQGGVRRNVDVDLDAGDVLDGRPGSGAGKGDGAGLDGDLEGLTGADGFRCVDDDRAGL